MARRGQRSSRETCRQALRQRIATHSEVVAPFCTLRRPCLLSRSAANARSVSGGVAMKKRMMIAFFATSLTAGASFAADWPLMGPQLYPSAPRMAVEWTGIYFGVNAGYGWAQGSSNTVFGGGATNTLLAATGLVIPAGATTPLGL